MAKYIEIWQPRWKDRTALIACNKVREGINLIKFTKTPSMTGIYSCDSDVIRACEVQSNGKIKYFVVPLYQLSEVE